MGDDGGARRSGPAINLPIAEVAAQCGYNNAHYFSKLFRQETGEESCGELTRFEDRLNHLATLLQCDSDAIRRLSGTRSFSTMEYLRAKEDFLPKPYSMQDGSGEYFSSLYVDSSLGTF